MAKITMLMDMLWYNACPVSQVFVVPRTPSIYQHAYKAHIFGTWDMSYAKAQYGIPNSLSSARVSGELGYTLYQRIFVGLGCYTSSLTKPLEYLLQIFLRSLSTLILVWYHAMSSDDSRRSPECGDRLHTCEYDAPLSLSMEPTRRKRNRRTR